MPRLEGVEIKEVIEAEGHVIGAVGDTNGGHCRVSIQPICDMLQKAFCFFCIQIETGFIEEKEVGFGGEGRFDEFLWAMAEVGLHFWADGTDA